MRSEIQIDVEGGHGVAQGKWLLNRLLVYSVNGLPSFCFEVVLRIAFSGRKLRPNAGRRQMGALHNEPFDGIGLLPKPIDFKNETIDKSRFHNFVLYQGVSYQRPVQRG